MTKTTTPQPTPAELGILTILWRLGPATVREVHEALENPVGYTTVLKFLQIMTEKKLVRRTETGRSHVYQPVVTEETTQRRMVSDLMDRAFGGSSARLVMQALSTKPASSEELQQIRQLLDGLNGDTQ